MLSPHFKKIGSFHIRQFWDKINRFYFYKLLKQLHRLCTFVIFESQRRDKIDAKGAEAEAATIP